MRLSEITAFARARVIRDAEFASLGLLSYDAPAMLVCLYDPKYLRRELLPNRSISAVITSEAGAPGVPEGLGLAVSDDPMECFNSVHEHLQLSGFYWTGRPNAIAPDTEVDAGAIVAAGNVTIGARTKVEAGAIILERTVIGADCVIRAGAVIGAEGFEPKPMGGRIRNMRHAGSVRIGDRVEVHSNCTVCKSLFGMVTEIGDDTVVATLANISHNVRIGRRCRIGCSAVVLGSSVVGDDVWVGPNATISNQVRIGEGASVALGSVVVRDVNPGEQVAGNFAIPRRRFLVAYQESNK